jgi:hypothetical protein
MCSWCNFNAVLINYTFYSLPCMCVSERIDISLRQVAKAKWYVTGSTAAHAHTRTQARARGVRAQGSRKLWALPWIVFSLLLFVRFLAFIRESQPERVAFATRRWLIHGDRICLECSGTANKARNSNLQRMVRSILREGSFQSSPQNIISVSVTGEVVEGKLNVD